MKKWLMVVAAIFIFFSPAYAKDGCETEVLETLNELKDVPHIPDEDKKKYTFQLKKALKLCREGKTAEGVKILLDVKFDSYSKAM